MKDKKPWYIKAVELYKVHPVANCVEDKSCRFWNTVYGVCPVGSRVPYDTPCMIAAAKEIELSEMELNGSAAQEGDAE